MKINIPGLIVAITASALLFSCAPSMLVRPLSKGQNVINAELGGPLIEYSSLTIPTPLSSLMYARGITDNTSAFGSVHTTSLLFGNIQTDIGVCQKIYYNDSLRLGISVNPALNMVCSIWDGSFKCWPEADLNFYWEIKPHKSFVYIGMENWFELSQTRAEDQPQTTHWIFCPQVGYTYSRTKWDYNIELKWIAPNIPNLPNVVSYIGIGGNGALGVYLGVTRKF